MKFLCKIGMHDWTDWIQQFVSFGRGYLWKSTCVDCDATKFLSGAGREWRA